MTEVASKPCVSCGQTLPLTSFGTRRVSEHCKTCRTTSKVCATCGEVQPVQVYGSHGRHANCRSCRSRRANLKYHTDPHTRALQIARSMNAAVTKRTRGRVTTQVNVAALAQLILSASASAFCRGPLDTFGYAVDHIIPLARNGPHTLENLTVACQPCNRAKGDLLEQEFRHWLAGVAAQSS